MTVDIAIEGSTDLPVVRKIVAAAGCEIGDVYGQRGKTSLMAGLHGFNQAARFTPWLVLRDLDSDAPCASALVSSSLPQPSKWMRFRIAVREMESWLLADREGFAEFLRISQALIPIDPDALADPKQTLVNLARRSTFRKLREDLVPAEGMSGTVGPGYTDRIVEFVEERWRVGVARTNSNSLNRCILRVAELGELYGR